MLNNKFFNGFAALSLFFFSVARRVPSRRGWGGCAMARLTPWLIRPCFAGAERGLFVSSPIHSLLHKMIATVT